MLVYWINAGLFLVVVLFNLILFTFYCKILQKLTWVQLS